MSIISQTVLYRPYAGNPDAADGIVALAEKYLKNIPGTELRVGKAILSSRTVVISNGAVIKTTSWKSESNQTHYFNHPQLKQYVEEVLHGWKLKGDPHTSESAEAFISHILRGTENLEWERNQSIPDAEVLWGSEAIILYEWNIL